MPIDVKIVNNSSQVRVKPKSQDEVKVKSDCDTKEKVIESKLKQEREERIAADEYLQYQINHLM